MVNYFSTDLLSDILLLLPVKSLARFKSVSIPWCCLIDDPYFIKSHLKHSSETNRGSKVIFRSKKDFQLYWVNVDSISTPGIGQELIGLPTQNTDATTTHLIGSCNGLMCLYHSPNIILWNKSTGEYHVTMPYTARDNPYLLSFMSYGFGYDSVSDDFKVLVIISCARTRKRLYAIRVYSLRNNAWSGKRNKIPYFNEDGTQDDRRGVIAGDALHWLAHWDYNSVLHNMNSFIFSFDLPTELFREIALPENANFFALGALGGNLAATSVEFSEGEKVGDVNIWVMEDPAKEMWTKLYRISGHSWLKYPRPLTYLRCGTQILLKANVCSRTFLLYSPGNGKLEDLYNTREVIVSSATEICLDTLVSISAYTGSQCRSQRQLSKGRGNGKGRGNRGGPENLPSFIKNRGTQFSALTLTLLVALLLVTLASFWWSISRLKRGYAGHRRYEDFDYYKFY